jgi:hypothetical protein
MSDSITFSVFADLHWREGDWSWCEQRLDDIFARAVRERAEFVIHCGDFCHDVVAARAMIAKYAAAPLPAYHVMGNHEFECSDSLDEVLRAFSMPRNYYSFDVRGFRFVAIDNNYHHGPDGNLKHYADESVWSKCHQDEVVLPPDQVAFLQEAIATAPGPVCVFSHASFLLPPDRGGVVNGREVVRMAEEARNGRPAMFFNGHYHRNELVVRDGMAFFDVNTTTSTWSDKEHHAYPPELMAKCPTACHSILNAVPVHAIVHLDAEGNVEIEGMKGAFYLGISPESLGIDSADKAGRKFTVNVLSARFSLTAS